MPSSLSVVQPTCQPGGTLPSSTNWTACGRHLQRTGPIDLYGSFSRNMIKTLLRQTETLLFAILHLQPAAAQEQPPSSSRPGAFGGSRARSAMMPRHSHSSNPPGSHQIPRTLWEGDWNQPTSTSLQVRSLDQISGLLMKLQSYSLTESLQGPYVPMWAKTESVTRVSRPKRPSQEPHRTKSVTGEH